MNWFADSSLGHFFMNRNRYPAMLAIEVDFGIGHLADYTHELFFRHGHGGEFPGPGAPLHVLLQ